VLETHVGRDAVFKPTWVCDAVLGTNVTLPNQGEVRRLPPVKNAGWPVDLSIAAHCAS